MKKKKETHLSDKQLKHYQKLLESTRAVITHDINHIESEHLKSHKESSGDLSGYSLHMADVGTDNYDQELALDVVGNEHDILYQINNALTKIESQTFGICEMYGSQIPKARLDAIPWTPYCKDAAEELERQKRNSF